MRRLEVTIAGRWYLALTIFIGVVALASGNNIIYLIESFLLSGLILSGILSERAISAVQIEIRRRPAVAHHLSHDSVILTNKRRYPVFCLEIGEWVGKKFHPIVFVPILAAHATVSVPSRQKHAGRGVHRWEGIAVATNYPFGFARKTKVIRTGGERLVWPSRYAGLFRHTSLNDSGEPVNRTGSTFLEGEARPLTFDDDHRLIIWTLSAKGTEPYVRPRGAEAGSHHATIDLRTDAGDEFEKRVIEAAERFYRAGDQAAGESDTLEILDWSGKSRVRGRRRALDRLATIRASGTTGARRK